MLEQFDSPIENASPHPLCFTDKNQTYKNIQEKQSPIVPLTLFKYVDNVFESNKTQSKQFEKN